MKKVNNFFSSKECSRNLKNVLECSRNLKNVLECSRNIYKECSRNIITNYKYS